MTIRGFWAFPYGSGFPLQSFCEGQKGFSLQSLTQGFYLGFFDCNLDVLNGGSGLLPEWKGWLSIAETTLWIKNGYSLSRFVIFLSIDKSMIFTG